LKFNVIVKLQRDLDKITVALLCNLLVAGELIVHPTYHDNLQSLYLRQVNLPLE
jgi:hypothetical protein